MRRRSAPAKLCLMDLDRAQATYDGALRRVIADLTSTTELRPDVVVDFTALVNCTTGTSPKVAVPMADPWGGMTMRSRQPSSWPT